MIPQHSRPMGRTRALACLWALLAPAAAIAAPTTTTAPAATDAAGTIETLEVQGVREDDPRRLELGGNAPVAGADLARALAHAPGVEAVENGPLSSQLQVRGLGGPAIGVRLEGMHVLSGGPNWMDPPLYVAPRGLLESVSLDRSPRGVADGPGPGAQANLRWKRPDFGDAGWQPWLDADAGASSVDQGDSVAAAFGLASARQRLYAGLSRETGDDYDTPDGHVRPSRYDRDAETLGYGLRYDGGQLDLAWRRIHSGDGGTPALPMDIRFIDTRIAQLDWHQQLGEAQLHLMAARSDVDHAMNNSRLRPTPDFSQLPLPPFAGPDARRVRADATGRELRASLALPVRAGTFTTGLDWRDESHDATVTDPDFAPFFLQNFVDARLATSSAFVQWDGSLAPATRLTAGVRAIRTRADADRVNAFPAALVDADPAAWPMGTPPRAVYVLRERFNGRVRSRTDTELDWSLALRHDLAPGLEVEADVARRSRPASYIERDLWIPLESTGGLADGNTYVGNPDLAPEVSHEFELALRYTGTRVQASLSGYWRAIDGAILGVPVTDPVTIAVSAGASGDPTPLAFASVDARIRGIEAESRFQLTDRFALEAAATWQQGERTEGRHDPLWRIAPPNARLALHWQGGTGIWSGDYRIEELLVARGDRLSRIQLDDPANRNNRFTETGAYALTNVHGHWQLPGGVELGIGIENLFDRSYRSPLAGFDRALGSSVAVGERLPGRGRNLYARIGYRLQ